MSVPYKHATSVESDFWKPLAIRLKVKFGNKVVVLVKSVIDGDGEVNEKQKYAVMCYFVWSGLTSINNQKEQRRSKSRMACCIILVGLA